MRLYHFTGREHLNGIRRDGLSLGSMLLPDGSFERPVQWLTKSSSWAQPWATRRIVHCDRSECRLPVVIPNAMRERLHRWCDYSRQFPREWVEEFNEAGGGGAVAREWYVFLGCIPTVQIVGLDFRPEGPGE